MTLPQKLTLDQMQNRWASLIEPTLSNPLVQGNILKGISLINGVTVINHLLSRMQQGWMIVDINAAATIYRSQPLNDKTLTLTSNASCVVNLYVF